MANSYIIYNMSYILIFHDFSSDHRYPPELEWINRLGLWDDEQHYTDKAPQHVIYLSFIFINNKSLYRRNTEVYIFEPRLKYLNRVGI